MLSRTMSNEPPDQMLAVTIGQYQDGKLVWSKSFEQVKQEMFMTWCSLLNGDKKEIARVMGIHLKTVYNMYNRYHHRIKRIDDARSMRDVSSEDSMPELRSRCQAESGTATVSTSGGRAVD